MRLVRYGRVGAEKPGMIDAEGGLRDLSGFIDDIDGRALARERLAELSKVDPTTLPIVPQGTRIGACIARPGKFICIGLNYADHAAESGVPVPDEPVVFLKATSALSGPNDPIIKPRGSIKLDWEAELAFVIGETSRYVDQRQGQQAIAGYFICNDVSERSFQLERGGQWDKGKGCDSFGPIGPWLVTPDEVGDPLQLDVWLDVNGRRFQSSSTSKMIFSPAYLVSYLSQFMSLHPGDIVTTGTPPGVGLGQKPQIFLSAGDEIRLGISGLGTQSQRVIDYIG